MHSAASRVYTRLAVSISHDDNHNTTVFFWLESRVFVNDPGDLGSISGRIITKTLKMVLDTSLFNTQQYKVRIEGKVEQSRERSSGIPYTTML